MEEFNILAGRVLETLPVDFEPFEDMAQQYTSVSRIRPAVEDVLIELEKQANEYLHRIIGEKVLYLTALYGIPKPTQTGILRDFDVLGKITAIESTEYLESPVAYINKSENWDGPGLGFVMEPYIPDGSDTEDDDATTVFDLQGVGIFFDEIVVPINGNVVAAGRALFQ